MAVRIEIDLIDEEDVDMLFELIDHVFIQALERMGVDDPWGDHE